VRVVAKGFFAGDLAAAFPVLIARAGPFDIGDIQFAAFGIENEPGRIPAGRMQPRSLLCPGSKSMTGDRVVRPVGDINRLPSGLIAIAFGVLPNSSFSAGRVDIVSRPCCLMSR